MPDLAVMLGRERLATITARKAGLTERTPRPLTRVHHLDRHCLGIHQEQGRQLLHPASPQQTGS